MTIQKNNLSIIWHRSKMALLLFAIMGAFALYFVQRYTIAFNAATSDCLRASVFLIDKWDREFTNDDIVAFVMNIKTDKFPVGRTWAKKVVGMPGETVLVDHDFVTVNGKKYPLSTSYVLKQMQWDFDVVKPEWKLTDQQVFMIGETLTSFDSRFWGPINKTDVVGKAYAIF